MRNILAAITPKRAAATLFATAMFGGVVAVPVAASVASVAPAVAAGAPAHHPNMYYD